MKLRTHLMVSVASVVFFATVQPVSAGPKPVHIIAESSEIHHMAVSSDNVHLVYSARGKGKSTHALKVWTIVKHPYRRKKLTLGVGASFSPDSSKIVYYSEAKGDNRYWVSTINPNGKGERNFGVEGVDPSASTASYSPTGRTILFTNRSGTYLVPVEGEAEPRQVTTRVLTAPHWHPSAPKVVFERKGGGVGELDVISGQIEALTPKGVGHRPRYSPDGLQVLFMVDFKIYVQSVADRSRREVVAEGVDAYWSNSGKGIVVVNEMGTFTKGQVIDLPDLSISWVPLDGTEALKLMDKAHGVAVRAGGRDLFISRHRVGVFRLKLPELDGEAEARRGLKSSATKTAPGRKEPVPKFSPPKTRATDKAIDPKVIKAVQ